ncbi:MAG: tetratricopeptide repeat protein [Desulfobacteraceae bacterium]|nr:tetratricopeptide repeat protein [Desulfobacteraceae bacterium]MBC2756689.1 tetratricopeptide repeat protein [Desulfobacteraceae bacterium]
MKKLIGTLAVLICFIFMLVGCGLKKVKSGAPEDHYMDDQVISPQKAGEDGSSGNSYYLFMESQIFRGRGRLDDAIYFMKLAMEKDSESLFLKKELAILYLHKKENEKALSVVEEILAKDPESVDALVMSATIKKTLNKEADVKPIYEKVLLIDSKRKSVYQILGKMYFSEGDMDNAFRVYEKMLDQFPDNYVGYYYIGEIYGVKADYDKAEESFLKTLELAPSLDEARLELVKIYRLTKQKQKIITMYEQILDRNPDNFIAAIELGLLYNKNDAVKSGSLLRDLGERSVSDPNVVGAVLQYLILQKRADDAVIVLNGMSEGAPESSEIAYATAVVYYEKGIMDLALENFKAVKSDTRFYQNALIHMAIIYYKNDDFDTGIEVLKEAMTKAPDSAKLELIPYLSSFYKEKEMTEESIKLIREGLLIDPESADLLFELGVIYDRQGKTDLAIEQMEAVLALNPEHADALNYLGYTYADKGIKLDEAETMIKKALEYKPDNGYIIDSLGWVYFKKGLYEEALLQLKRAVELISDDPVVLEHLGDIYIQMNDPAKARKYYERALQVEDKDKKGLREKIDSLNQKGF